MTEATKTRGGGWVVGQSVLMAGAILASVLWRDHWYSAWTFGFGLALFATGGIVGVLGVLHLGRNRTPFPRPLADSDLVETGVYSLVRHPLYLSVMLACLGWAGIWSSGPGLALALVLIGYLDAKARREERWLLERYPGYRTYADRVKRFVPGIY
jgi:protein-S-isoprenylcysteine O-methyltransferase Ste14